MNDAEKLSVFAAMERLAKEEGISDAQLGDWVRTVLKTMDLIDEASELETLLARLRPMQ
jgi:transposase-like protein